MSNSVVIKSFSDGISVYLDKDLPFTQLLEEIKMKFIDSEKFFQKAKLAISFEGRKLKDTEERKIIDVITANTSMQILCIVGKDDVHNQVFLKAIKQAEKENDTDNVQFFKGNLTDHEILESERSIIILGDVYPGCAVTSSKDIIVLGGLYGEAYAGADGEPGHFVVALEMLPEKLKVQDIRYKAAKSIWPVKQKIQPKIVYLRKNKLVIETLTKDALNLIGSL